MPTHLGSETGHGADVTVASDAAGKADWDDVLEASWASFPASDPPAWIGRIPELTFHERSSSASPEKTHHGAGTRKRS